MRIYLLIILFNILTISAFTQETSDCPEIDNRRAERLVKDAADEMRSKRYLQANNLLKQALELEPEYAEAYFMLGLINIQRRDYNLRAAQNYFLKTLEVCPTYDVYAHYYLGDIYLGARNYDSAAIHFREFLRDVEKIKTDADYNDATTKYETANFYARAFNHPVPFNPRPVRGISSPLDEYLAIITPNNEMALYTRKIEVQQRTAWASEKRFVERFLFSKRGDDGEFDNGEFMPSPFNQGNDEGGATVTIDNREMFFTVCKMTSVNYYNCDIFTSKLEGGFWSEIVSLGANVNTPDTWETQPTVSSDGKTLYFVSDRPGGSGGYDMYKTTRNENGEWGRAVNMGNVINTPGNERSPFIHTDSQTLYFASGDKTTTDNQIFKGHPGVGGYDIFYSKMNDNGQWERPKNIGYPINTQSDEASFFVSTDGKTAYVASNSLQGGPGGWDLYAFELYADARPEKVLFISGEITQEDNAIPADARVELRNAVTRRVTSIPVNQETGRYVAAVRFDGDYILTIKQENYAYESTYISAEDTTFNTPANIDFEVKPIEIGREYTIKDIFFETDNYDLTRQAKFLIEEFSEFLKDHPHIKVEVQGHTDNIGGPEYNLFLSDDRAKAVYDYLIQLGISSSQVGYKGYGLTRPIDSNATEAGRAKNRRTSFFIINN
ncbi:MAG: OmpA family protein [Bacteroidales bacterium]|nr:OmpA family protein [Bacteroidales bacterium]